MGMAARIGINGFGRIGKLVLRLSLETPDLQVVQVNDPMGIEMMAHLLAYDSLHGKLPAKVGHDARGLLVGGRGIPVSGAASPAAIPWRQGGAEFIVEASGRFKDRPSLLGHLENGARKVILSCPAADDSLDRMVVVGVNHQNLRPGDALISNASCTTNCVAIVLRVLMEEFGVRRAFLNTVHPVTNNQNLQDGPHDDFRRARSAVCNIIPTTTSAVPAVQAIFPEMRGLFDGMATRVPVADCSFVELTAQLQRATRREEINEAFRRHAARELAGILEFVSDPIVSRDVNGNRHSAVFDSLATKVLDGDLVQVLAWYDNETGYAARILDLLRHISGRT